MYLTKKSNKLLKAFSNKEAVSIEAAFLFGAYVFHTVILFFRNFGFHSYLCRTKISNHESIHCRNPRTHPLVQPVFSYFLNCIESLLHYGITFIHNFFK